MKIIDLFVRSALVATLLIAGSFVAVASSEPEEVPTPTENVPLSVREKAASITAGLGEDVRCDAWFWDTEDDLWECTVVGLNRKVELDIPEPAGFEELELVFTFEEVRESLPYVALTIEETCEDVRHTVIELSLRDENRLDIDLDLPHQWSKDDVRIEVQCPNGYDFEMDPFGAMTTAADDDVNPEDEP
ncbi:MAG: hypothetical protein PVF68_06035 [Acidobacteriota bacterium]